jgi:hypothetical protein
MSHPEHGRMPVYSDIEIEYNKKFGWILDEEKPVDVETPEEAYEKKFGKPPHHRLKLDTIIKRLEE